MTKPRRIVAVALLFTLSSQRWSVLAQTVNSASKPAGKSRYAEQIKSFEESAEKQMALDRTVGLNPNAPANSVVSKQIPG